MTAGAMTANERSAATILDDIAMARSPAAVSTQPELAKKCSTGYNFH
jgi:hypothetical protein